MCFGSSDRSQDRWDNAPRPAKGYGGYSDRTNSINSIKLPQAGEEEEEEALRHERE